MDKEIILTKIYNQYKKTITKKINIYDYFDELFYLSVGISFGLISLNEEITNLFSKISDKIEIENVLYTNEQLIVKTLYILWFLDYYNIKHSVNFNEISIPFLIKREFNALDLYYLSKLDFIKSADFRNYNKLIENRINNMLTNLNQINLEYEPFILFYFITNFKNLNSKDLNNLINYYNNQFLLTNNINDFCCLFYLAPNLEQLAKVINSKNFNNISNFSIQLLMEKLK